MTSPGQFLPPPPPALSSARYAHDLNEVETLGSATSTVRTAWQTETAVFWKSDTPGRDLGQGGRRPDRRK